MAASICGQWNFHYSGIHNCAGLDGYIEVVPFAGHKEHRNEILMWRVCGRCGGRIGLRLNRSSPQKQRRYNDDI